MFSRLVIFSVLLKTKLDFQHHLVFQSLMETKNLSGLNMLCFIFYFFGSITVKNINTKSHKLPSPSLLSPRSLLTMRMQSCHLVSVPFWTLRWPCVAVTPSQSSISSLWRKWDLTMRMPGTSLPLLLSLPCPTDSPTSPI